MNSWIFDHGLTASWVVGDSKGRGAIQSTTRWAISGNGTLQTHACRWSRREQRLHKAARMGGVQLDAFVFANESTHNFAGVSDPKCRYRTAFQLGGAFEQQLVCPAHADGLIVPHDYVLSPDQA